MDTSSGSFKYSKILYIGILILGLFVGSILTKSFSNNTKTENTVTVVGNGTIEVPADQAIIYAKTSVISTNKVKAAADNNKLTENLTNILLKNGVSEEAINIATYVDPVYSDYTNYQPIPTGSESGTLSQSSATGEYNANSSFTITLNNLNSASKIEDIIKSTPQVELNGTSNYVLKDPTKYESQAREKALLDARNQADKIAQINDLKIGKVISITDEKSKTPKETDGYYPTPYIKAYADYGEKTVRVTASYTVKYELNNKLLPL
jgi:uncharacterized protein YggE